MIRAGRFLILFGAVALLGACGEDEGGGLSDSEQEYADAFAATLADADNGFGVADDHAQCMGDAVMAELGGDVFEEAGVEPGDIDADGDPPGALLGDGTITRDQALAIVDSWEDCTDLVDMLIASAGSELGLDPAGETCFRKGLDKDDLVKRVLIGPFMSEEGDPDDDTVSAFLALLEDCSGDDGSPIVKAMAESLAADGTLTTEQAECLAQGVVDIIGLDRMSELFTTGDFDDLDTGAQSEVAGALLQAAGDCGVSPSDFTG